MKQVRFRVLAEEATPETATQELLHVRPRSKLLLQGMEAHPDCSGQRPLHHFGVRGGGQVGAAKWRMRAQVFVRRRRHEPPGIGLQRREETFEPAVAVAVIVCARPDAEFLAVVAHGRQPVRVLAGHATQELDRILHRAKWDQIAQPFQAGNDFHGLAAILGDVGTVKLLKLESAGQKMEVVHQCIVHASLRHHGGERRFPDAFGQPGALRAQPKPSFQVVGHPPELFPLVFRRDGNQNRLVKTPADQFRLATSH